MRINLTHLARTRVLTPQSPRFGAILGALQKFAPALFATYNYKGGYSGGSNTGMVATPGVVNVADIKLDFAAIAAARAAAGQAAIGAADVLELFGIKADTWVRAAFVKVTKAEGAAATGQLGDGTDPNGFIETAGLNLNATGWYSSLITSAFSLATAGGKIYAADDTVDLTIDSAAVDVAVAHLYLETVDLRSYRT